MLTMRPRFDTVLVRFKPVVPRRPPCAVFLMNRDGSGYVKTYGATTLFTLFLL